jgi:membrane-associated phospholipid phosphatase
VRVTRPAGERESAFAPLGRRLALALLLAAPLSGSALAADLGGTGDERAGTPAASPAPSGEVTARGDGRRTMARLPANLVWSAIGVLHADNLGPLLAGGAAGAAASFFDDDVREHVQASDWGESFETGAGPVWSTVFVAGMFTAGRLSNGARFRAMTYDMLDAAIVNFVYTGVVKVAVGRERPNSQDEKSFPSGHTSNSFALAAVAERHYGWKLGVPAYLLAGLVGASRIQQDKHYLSDVVAGATLGYIVGRTVVRVNNRPLEEGPGRASLQVSPILGPGTRGVMVALSY